MAQVSRRTGFNGSALVRWLSRLTDIDVRESSQGTADRLSQWFGWTDAISLSAALNGSPAASSSGARASASTEEGECTRVRTTLAKAIAEDSVFTTDKGRGHAHAPASEDAMDTTADFTPYRRRYLAQQQAMETGIGPLRGRLRATLAARSPAMARLAAVDVVMEQVLAARERSLLSSVPALLERHFGRLQQAARAMPGEADGGIPPRAWRNVFHQDIQDVLRAELDFRFQPVEGLLEALRTRQQPECHD
jgi:hypothetical protein